MSYIQRLWYIAFCCIAIGACDRKPEIAILETEPGFIVHALHISSQGVIDSATAGNKELSEYNDAAIVMSIQVLHSGKAALNIAPLGHSGNSQSKIDLPPGWYLNTPVVPGGGCLLQPTHLYNDGKGGYTLHVMTMSIYGACPWLKREYAYRIAIDTGQYSGGTVGKIIVP